MVQHTTFSASQSAPDSSLRMDAWAQARKRADDYLKLHRLPGTEREQLLARVAHKLTRTAPCPDHELIQLFIRTVQEELDAQKQAQPAAVYEPSNAAYDLEDDAETLAQKAEARTQTGPRFERSSIRVAPLRAITLLPLRSRQHRSHH
ncbi:MAG: hypothetical protein PHE17_00095 [Thiothrix sp.]|uniref:hypothetical protein n=1 Tax=Thiothrix sp. TaxID=1032 RepID=UPI00261D9B44|nr:hypothetical protein [Thiothrix sp.]MDD5391391.1 hypothetical protein [Thiothrix sp.]